MFLNLKVIWPQSSKLEVVQYNNLAIKKNGHNIINTVLIRSSLYKILKMVLNKTAKFHKGNQVKQDVSKSEGNLVSI